MSALRQWRFRFDDLFLKAFLYAARLPTGRTIVLLLIAVALLVFLDPLLLSAYVEHHHNFVLQVAILFTGFGLLLAVSFSLVLMSAAIGSRRDWSPRTVSVVPCIVAGIVAAAFWVLPYGSGYVNRPLTSATITFTLTVAFSAYGRKIAFPALGLYVPDPQDIIRLFADPPNKKA